VHTTRRTAFYIMDFPAHSRGTEPPIVYRDGLTGALYLDGSVSIPWRR
jgi:hypothetical protein